MYPYGCALIVMGWMLVSTEVDSWDLCLGRFSAYSTGCILSDVHNSSHKLNAQCLAMSFVFVLYCLLFPTLYLGQSGFDTVWKKNTIEISAKARTLLYEEMGKHVPSGTVGDRDTHMTEPSTSSKGTGSIGYGVKLFFVFSRFWPPVLVG